ncbi:MAG: metal-dependent transcriptional regulator, partial [Clostridia bacterium]|nr:metal-dependent transcriptional regulator [Clostridia bacterium]
MALHESAEMYLETIYTLAKERGNVRSIDVA